MGSGMTPFISVFLLVYLYLVLLDTVGLAVEGKMRVAVSDIRTFEMSECQVWYEK